MKIKKNGDNIITWAGSKFAEDITDYSESNFEIDELEEKEIRKIKKLKNFYRIGYCSICDKPYNSTNTKIKKEITTCRKCSLKKSIKLLAKYNKGRKRTPEAIKKSKENQKKYMQTEKYQKNLKNCREKALKRWAKLSINDRKKISKQQKALWQKDEFLFKIFKTLLFKNIPDNELTNLDKQIILAKSLLCKEGLLKK